MSSSASESSITPERASAFEHIVRHLRLSPDEYESSHALKEWVRRNKDQKYVPSYLLVAWHFDVNVKIFAKIPKSRKRAA